MTEIERIIKNPTMSKVGNCAMVADWMVTNPKALAKALEQYVIKARIESAKGIYALWREDNSNVGSGEVFILKLEAQLKKGLK